MIGQAGIGQVGKLLDLGFLEVDVLTRHRIVFAEREFLGRLARILLGNVVEAGPGGALEFDQNGVRLSHDRFLGRRVPKGREGPTT